VNLDLSVVTLKLQQEKIHKHLYLMLHLALVCVAFHLRAGSALQILHGQRDVPQIITP